MDGLAKGAGATLMGGGGPSAGLASGGERGDDLSSGSKDVSSFGAGVGGEKGVRMLRAGGSTSPSPLPPLPLPLPPRGLRRARPSKKERGGWYCGGR